MIKVIVQRKGNGDTKEYRRHNLIDIIIMYVGAALLLGFTLACMISRLHLLALLFLALSFIFFSKGLEWDRQNLLIEFVVDLSQALTENSEEGGTK